MRTKKSLFNLTSALIGQGIALLANLVARVLFTKYMTQEYLGLSGLFTNILTMLSLVELGVGPAITFSLYKPLAEKNTELIKSLMRLYSRTYRAIGCAILIIGIGFAPFYPFFIKDTGAVSHLNTIYLLYVANTGISYFYSYKISLITADQNQYIRNIGHYTSFVILNVVQTTVLALTRNYILYLVCQVVFTFLENAILSCVANRMYPYLKEKNVKPLTQDIVKPIVRNIKAMMFHKIGSLVVNSTDNLLISRFLGLAISGIYANYSLVLTAVRSILAQVFDSIVSSVGNLNALDDREKVWMVYQRIYFLSFWLYGFCSICLLCLIQPFIVLAFGKNYLLSNFTVIALVLSFYTTGMRRAPIVMRSAAGLYYRDWPKPIFESLVNLIASIAFLKWFGPAGIFLGTVASTILVCGWVEAYIAYKYALKKPLKRFFVDYTQYTVVTIIAACSTQLVCNLVWQESIGAFLLKMIICALLPNIIFCLFYWRNEKLKYFICLIKNISIQIWGKLVRR